MELYDYNLTFVCIKGTDNILADAISRLKTLDINMELLENHKTAALNNAEECITEVVANKIQTLNTDRHHAEQNKDINCKNVATQLHHKNRNSFNLVMISTDGLQK